VAGLVRLPKAFLEKFIAMGCCQVNRISGISNLIVEAGAGVFPDPIAEGGTRRGVRRGGTTGGFPVSGSGSTPAPDSLHLNLRGNL
jgi:hypothetical protein